MRAFSILLVREIRRRLPAHFVSLGLAVVALLAPSLIGTIAGAHRGEIRGAVAVGLALLWALSLAFIEGLSALAGDLRERRLAFDLRLPVPAVAIWAGRLLAAALSVATAAVLVLGLAAAAGADLGWGLQGLLELAQGGTGFELRRPALVLAMFLLAAFLALDLVGLALASRSAWIGLDLASAVAFKSLAFLAIAPLWRLGAEVEAGLLLVAAIGCGLLALVVASLRQVVSGRTEADRAHRAFSATFALLALATVLPLAAWSRWYRTAEPADLVRQSVDASSLTDDLVWLAGPARHRGALRHSFLLEPRSGRYLRLTVAHTGFGRSSARISVDRSRVAWLAIDRRSARRWTARVRYADSPSALAEPRESGIEWGAVPFAWALSPDGSQVASVWRNESRGSSLRLRVDELESGGQIQVLTIEGCGSPGMLTFLDETTLLYGCGWASPQSDLISAYTLRIDLRTGESSFGGWTPYSDRPVDVAHAVAADRRFEPPPDRWSGTRREPGHLDLAGREPVEILPPAPLEPASHVSSARFLADGRLVVAWIDWRKSVLAVYAESGELLRSFPTQLSRPFLYGESGDSLFVGARTQLGFYGPVTTTLYRLSLHDDAVTEVANGLQPYPPSSDWTPTTLFRSSEGELLWLDLSTGKLVPLFAAF